MQDASVSTACIALFYASLLSSACELIVTKFI